jgi:hypothetical protein
MVLIEKGKEGSILVYLNNHKELFQAFIFNGDGPVIMKFDIRDLELIGLIFENTNIALSLHFTADTMTVKHENELLGWTAYRIDACAQL